MVNDTKKVYFLPKKLEFVLTHESAVGIDVVPKSVEVEGFKIPGYILSGNSENLRRFLECAPAWSGAHDLPLKIKGKSGLVICDSIHIDGEECSFLSLVPLVVHDMMDCGSELSFMRNLQADIVKTLEDFSKWTGQNVLLAAPETSCMRPKISDKSFGIHIVIGASPPGDAPMIHHQKLCGLDLADNHAVVGHRGPARGQGGVVKDKDGEPVAQIISDTLYLFVPIWTPCERTLMESGGAGLFKKVFRLAWNAYVERPRKQVAPEEVPIGNAGEYGKFLDDDLEKKCIANRNEIAEINEKIDGLETKIRSLLNEKRLMCMLLQQYAAMQQDVAFKQRKKDWNRIRTLSGVKKVSVVDGGIHVETDILTTTHAGVKYRLGSFIIRYSYDGIFVWSHESVHNRGRAHPHISEVGTVCFGNIGTAIRSAAIESRIADAVEFVLRWLTEGYDPELADTRIEEWPREEESV